MRRNLSWVFLIAVIVAPTSCGDDDSTRSAGAIEGAIALSSSEVTTLLGIKPDSGVAVGAITSNRDGVKISSISLKSDDNPEFAAKDIELRIISTGKLAYALSYLQLGQLRIDDSRTKRRVQAFGIRVDEPGERFLTTLASVIGFADSSGTAKIAQLSCLRLAIEKVEYLLLDEEANHPYLTVVGVSVNDASSATIGELRVGHIALDDVIAIDGLTVAKVDRAWANEVLAQLAYAYATEAAACAAAASDKAFAEACYRRITEDVKGQPYSVEAAERAHRDIARMRAEHDRLRAARSPVPLEAPSKSWAKTDKAVPFERFEVLSAKIQLDRHRAAESIAIDGLRLEVERNGAAFAAIHGAGRVTVSSVIVGYVTYPGLLAAVSPKFAESVTGNVSLSMEVASGNLEYCEASIGVPALGSISAVAITRGLPTALGMLFQGDWPRKTYMGIASLHVEYHDDGLASVLSNETFASRSDAIKAVRDISVDWHGGAERRRLSAEIDAFLGAPSGITFASNHDGTVSFDYFFGAKGLAAAQLSFTHR